MFLFTHPSGTLHEMGAFHPESPRRLQAIGEQLVASGLDSGLSRREAPAATREQLGRVHDAAYIDSVFSASPEKGLHWLDADTAMNPHSLDAALHAAGAVIGAVEAVLEGGPNTQAFCAIRPPGHHAEPDRAMGFCLFNNIAIGAAHALEGLGLERVAIVDFDVHHGNGTESAFAGDERVLFCSSFQHPFYPGGGAGCDAHNVYNVPLPAGTDGAAYRAVVGPIWSDAIRDFRPQLVMFSAGFDAHAEDEMSQLELRDEDYDWVTRMVLDAAGTACGRRVVSVLEGGYDLPSLARSVVVHLEAMQ